MLFSRNGTLMLLQSRWLAAGCQRYSHTVAKKLESDLEGCLEIMRCKYLTKDQIGRSSSEEIVQALTQFVRLLEKYPTDALQGMHDDRFVTFRSSAMMNAIGRLNGRGILQLLLTLQTALEHRWGQNEWLAEAAAAIIDWTLRDHPLITPPQARCRNRPCMFLRLSPSQSCEFALRFSALQKHIAGSTLEAKLHSAYTMQVSDSLWVQRLNLLDVECLLSSFRRLDWQIHAGYQPLLRQLTSILRSVSASPTLCQRWHISLVNLLDLVSRLRRCPIPTRLIANHLACLKGSLWCSFTAQQVLIALDRLKRTQPHLLERERRTRDIYTTTVGDCLKALHNPSTALDSSEATPLLRALYGLRLHRCCSVPLMLKLFVTSLEHDDPVDSEIPTKQQQLLLQLLTEADLSTVLIRQGLSRSKMTVSASSSCATSTEVLQALLTTSVKSKVYAALSRSFREQRVLSIGETSERIS